jgi:hypothetical protein
MSGPSRIIKKRRLILSSSSDLCNMCFCCNLRIGRVMRGKWSETVFFVVKFLQWYFILHNNEYPSITELKFKRSIPSINNKYSVDVAPLLPFDTVLLLSFSIHAS